MGKGSAAGAGTGTHRQLMLNQGCEAHRRVIGQHRQGDLQPDMSETYRTECFIGLFLHLYFSAVTTLMVCLSTQHWHNQPTGTFSAPEWYHAMQTAKTP